VGDAHGESALSRIRMPTLLYSIEELWNAILPMMTKAPDA